MPSHFLVNPFFPAGVTVHRINFNQKNIINVVKNKRISIRDALDE